MENVYFLHQMYRNKNTNIWNKGIVVKDNPTENNWDAVRQSYYAYLGAYGFGHSADVDYVQCEVTDLFGNRLLQEIWMAPTPVEEEEEAEPVAPEIGPDEPNITPEEP